MSDIKFFEFITKDVVKQILKECVLAMTELREWENKHSIDIKTKQSSEIFSKIVESKATSILKAVYPGSVKCAQCDKDPDMLFDGGIPLEIKVTVGETWTGGEYSKRPCNHLLISRDINYECISSSKFFVAIVNLQSDDWHSGGKSYYGTHYGKKDLIAKAEKVCLLGSLRYSGRGVKLEREGIFQQNFLHQQC